MIIFLHGPDDYRREQKKKFYIEEFKKKYPTSGAEYFDMEKTEELERFGVFARSQSIFAENKMAVLENVYPRTKESSARVGVGVYVPEEKMAAKLFASLIDDRATTVLFSESKKPPRTLGFLLEKPSKTEEFGVLSGAEWLKFIDETAKKIGLSLEPAAINFLGEIYAGNSWGLVTELEKISNLKKIVSRKDLENLGLEVAPNYWAVINGVRSASVATRLRALEKLSSQNEPLEKVFNILSSMWKEKTPQMAEYDFMVKSGKLGYEEALLELVLS